MYEMGVLCHIPGFLLLTSVLVGAKQFVPHDENLRIIFIEVNGVDGMVYSMMTRSDDDLFQYSHRANMLGMIPELERRGG